MKIRFKKLHEDAVLPSHAHKGDAGIDLTSVRVTKDEYGNSVHYFGLSVEIPAGYVGLMFARSSVYKHCQTPTNSVGVIDSGYRGELMMKFQRTSTPSEYSIEKTSYKVSDRVCQLVIVPHITVDSEWAEELTETARGVNGYGSSGK